MDIPETKFAETDLLRIAYEQQGEGPPILLLHGWPDDVRTWDRVADGLAGAGFTTLAPWLRGYGPTTFRHVDTPRSGQIAALAQDAVDLLDALGVGQAIVVGHDWGAWAAYALAALWPERIERIVTLASGYGTGIKPGWEIEPAQSHAYWYQWFWQTAQGEQALGRRRRDICRYIWRVWSPPLAFTDEEFEATAAAWDNPDWVATTLHAYRVRWGAAPKDPRYDALEARLEEHPKITVPTVVLYGEEDGVGVASWASGQEDSFTGPYRQEVLPGVGHFISREHPEAVLDAALNDARSRK